VLCGGGVDVEVGVIVTAVGGRGVGSGIGVGSDIIVDVIVGCCLYTIAKYESCET
jgi:hypothetical protein